MENQQQAAEHPESEVLPASATTDDAPKNSTQPRRQGSSWAMRLGLLLALAMGGAALAGGYFLYQQQLAQFKYTQSVEEAANRATQEPLARLGSLEQGQQRQLSQLETELGRLTADQSALERRLANLAQKTPDDWLISEADYLVRMAGRKLWLELDPSTSLSLLKAADERIAAMQNPALLTLRKSLAQDMEQVAAIRSTDIAGNVYALDEIMKRLERLTPGRINQERSVSTQTDAALSDSLNDWRTNLAKSWQALINDFVTIRHRSQEITPLLLPEQEWYLKENIRTKLLQAQLALYRHDEQSFREALLMASGWIKLYFSQEQGTGAQIVERLEKLADLRIDRVPISKFQSSDLLRTLVQDGLPIEAPQPQPAPINPQIPDKEPEPDSSAPNEEVQP